MRDPIEDKKAAVVARAARTRANLDEYNERSDRLRQDWATSQNEVLRMAGNALREIVVCAEEDLLMLEDELGRLEGILAPADHDGPAGRVTSGQYGSEVGGAGGVRGGRHTLLASQRIPSVPRSPTVPLEPQSASKLGVQGEDSSGRGDSSSDGPSPAVLGFVTGDRVKNFLMGPTGPARAQPFGLTNKKNLTTTGALGSRHRIGAKLPTGRQTFSSLHDAPPTPTYAQPVKQDDDKNNESPSPSTALDVPLPPAAGSGMGLVEWQLMYGNQTFSAAEDSPEFWDRLNVKSLQVGPSPDSTSSIGTSPYGTNPNTNTFSLPQEAGPVEPVFRRPNRQLAARLAHPSTMAVAHHGSEDVLTSSALLSDSHNYGFHVAQPLGRYPGGDLATTTATRANAPAPGVGRLPSAQQSVAIKDFQVRVWKSATATATAKDAQAAPAAAKEGEVKNKEKAETRTEQGDADTRKNLEKIREEFRKQISELAAAKQATDGGGSRPQEGSGTKREGEGSERVDDAGDGATATDADGGAVVAGSEEDDVFRRSKMGTVGSRSDAEVDDPFV